MIHDFNRPFLDIVDIRITPVSVLSKGSNCIVSSRSHLVFRGLPSKMFEATNVAEDLFKLSKRLSSKFSHQALSSSSVDSILYVATSDCEHYFELGPSDTKVYYHLKQLLLTSFGDIYIELSISCPTARVNSVFDFFVNLLHRQYILCRDIQNTYECSTVLF